MITEKFSEIPLCLYMYIPSFLSHSILHSNKNAIKV